MNLLPQASEYKSELKTVELSRNLSGRAALRREQREQLKCNHRENRARGRKTRPITGITSTALEREEMAVRLAIRDEKP
jgi:hypothetical protein